MLRAADAGDMEWLFETRNDPWIVSFGASPSPFTWEEHQRWFRSVQNHQEHLVFLIESEEGAPQRIGTVRVDRLTDGTAKISAYLLRDFIGRGIGPKAIAEACRRAFADWPTLRAIEARIRADNVRSIRAFAKVGFAPHERSGDLEVMRLVRPEGLVA